MLDIISAELFGLITLLCLLVPLFATRKKIWLILVIAYVARAGLGWIETTHKIFPYSWDEAIYYGNAKEITEKWYRSGFYIPQHNVALNMNWLNGRFVYSVFCCLVYYFIELTPYTSCVINALFGTITIYYVHRIAVIMYGKYSVGIYAAWILAVTPSFVLYSGMPHMRDAFGCLCIVVFVYQFSMWIQYRKRRFLVICFFSLLTITWIRMQLLPVLLAIVFVFFWFNSIAESRTMFLRRAICVMVIPLIVGGLWIALYLFEAHGFRAIDLQEINQQMEWRRNEGRSQYLTHHVYSNWSDVLWFLPNRLVHFVFGPFLWNAYNGSQILASLEGLMYFVMVVVLGKKYVGSGFGFVNRISGWFLFVFCVVGLSSSAVFDTDYGTASRHRINFVWVLPMMFAGIIGIRNRIVNNCRNPSVDN